LSFDLICAAVALLFLVLGLFRGLIRQLLGVAGFLGGLILARIFAAPAAVAFGPALGLSPTVGTIAFSIALFFIVEVIARLVANFLHEHLGAISGTLDRLAGGALGLAKGLLVVWAIACLASLLYRHLPASERNRGVLATLDIGHSKFVGWADDESFLGDVEQQLRGERARPGAAPKSGGTIRDSRTGAAIRIKP